jgi:branched-chain amino acid transport system substrate-binding protein
MKNAIGSRCGAWGALVLYLPVLLASASCTRGDRREGSGGAAGETRDAVIAVAWPWELRKEIRLEDGLQMAVDEINAAGGVGGRRLRIAKYDDHESIDSGRVVAQKITHDPDVVAVIGHLQSYVTVQTADVYNQAGLVLLAPTATDPELTGRGYPRVFRATFNDRVVGRNLADFAAKRKVKTVAIYYIRDNYGKNVANAFEARAVQVGVRVVARESYDPSEKANEGTFDRVVGEWKQLDVDAIILAGEVPSAAIFVSQARRHGIKVPIFGGDAMSSPALMAVAGAAADGVIVASFFHPDDPRPEVARFKEAFSKRFGAAPDAGAALGYDCVQLLGQAIRQAGSARPEEIARAMHAMPPWKGVTATFQFDEHGDVVARPIVMSVVRGEKFEYLESIAPGAVAERQ